jgi:four helix bundle protein
MGIEELEHEEVVRKSNEKIFDIRERAFSFAVRIVKLCQHLEKHSEISKRLIGQLLDAGTSVGANPEEAQGGQSKPDFISKNSISLKEARETTYGLRLILATNKFDENIKLGVEDLIAESGEISKIIGAIILSAKK